MKWFCLPAAALLLAACQSVPSSQGSSDVSGDRIPVQFVFENIPLSWWKGNPPAGGTTLFLSVFFHDRGFFKSHSSQADTLRLFNSDGFEWKSDFTPGPEVSGRWFRFPSRQPGLFDLGEYVMDVHSSNVAIWQKQFRPSSVTPQGWLQYDYVYSPEYPGPLNEHYLRALGRPTVKAVRLDGSTATVEFVSGDSRAVFGSIDFLDAENKVIAEYPLPSDPPFLNDGSTNRVQVGTDQLKYTDGRTAADIQGVSVQLFNASLPFGHIDMDQVALVSFSEIAPFNSAGATSP